MSNPIDESLPYCHDGDMPTETQPAWSVVVRLLIPSMDIHGVPVDTIDAASEYVSETLRGLFLDWSYLESADGDGFQLPKQVTVSRPYLEGSWLL